MAAKLTRLTHKIAIQLHLVAESFIIRSSSSRRPIRKFLDTPSYILPSGRMIKFHTHTKTLHDYTKHAIRKLARNFRSII